MLSARAGSVSAGGRPSRLVENNWAVSGTCEYTRAVFLFGCGEGCGLIEKLRLVLVSSLFHKAFGYLFH